MFPDVSIIIPAYNTEAYIAKAIDSALSQTLENIEVIVVDDASTDHTVEIVQQFTDPRLILLKNPQNMGVSAARNRALEQAKGRWIAVLDSDDWYAPNRLENLLEIAESWQADLIIDDLNLVQNHQSSPWSTLLRESGEMIIKPWAIDPIFYVKTGFYGERGLHLGLCKPLFRRSFLQQQQLRYQETQQVVEDFQLVLQCLLQGAEMIFVPEAYYFYRSRPGSLVTHSRLRHIQQFQSVLIDFIKQEEVQKNVELVSVISQSLLILKRNEQYYRVIEPLKQRRLILVASSAIRNPYFFVHLFKQLHLIIWRRYRYYILKDKLVYEIVYRRN